MTARQGIRVNFRERITCTHRPVQDSLKRLARTGQLGRDKSVMTRQPSTEHTNRLGQESLERTPRTGQPEQDMLYFLEVNVQILSTLNNN
jgi:hypothetical protein